MFYESFKKFDSEIQDLSLSIVETILIDNEDKFIEELFYKSDGLSFLVAILQVNILISH